MTVDLFHIKNNYIRKTKEVVGADFSQRSLPKNNLSLVILILEATIVGPKIKIVWSSS